MTDPSGKIAGRLDWAEGVLEAKAAATADRAIAINRAQERLMALHAARQLAYLKLAEVVEGVSIDGVTVVRNAMVADQTVRTTVRARIAGARVVGEDVRELADGSVWAEVTVQLRVRGPGSLTDTVAPWLTARPAESFVGDPALRVSERYTGLIVDASDVDFSPAVAPRLLEEGTGKVVFGPHLVRLASLKQHGAVGYASGMAEARGAGRVGGNPLIVRATRASGNRKGDLLLSGRDAERVLAADRQDGFLGRGAVILVLGKDRRELATVPGRRHALLIGVDEYRQDAGSFPRLSYAARDARSLAAVLGRAGRVGPADLVVLENREATRKRVIDALRSLRSRVREEDVVFLFFSGHGTIGTGADGRPRYFFVPSDGVLSNLAGTALADDLVEELVGQLAARQVLVLLDTCYAGAGGGTIRARGVTNPAAQAAPPVRPVVEGTTGRVVVSASRADQLAFEDDRRGSGLFTGFVLDGLQGAADMDGDGGVTALELFRFVERRVPEHALRYFRVEQTPVLDARGVSGDIVITRRP